MDIDNAIYWKLWNLHSHSKYVFHSNYMAHVSIFRFGRLSERDFLWPAKSLRFTAPHKKKTEITLIEC